MILLDKRAGSIALAAHLPKAITKQTVLVAGDVAIPGNGPDNSIVWVGVEYKKLDDALKCMTDGRFSGTQLPGMQMEYPYRWLLVEGAVKSSSDGLLMTRRDSKTPYWSEVRLGTRRFMYKEWIRWLMTMEVMGGMRIHQSLDIWDSAEWIVNLHAWWTDKEFEEHHAHLQLDESGQPSLVNRPGLVRRVAKELPGVGWKRSGQVAGRFGSVKAMVDGTVVDWLAVPGIGKITAQKIVEALRNGNKEQVAVAVKDSEAGL